MLTGFATVRRQEENFHLVAVAYFRAREQESRRGRVDVRDDAEGPQMGCVAGLDEHGLPDTAGRRVPLPLFANGLLGVIHRVLDAQDDDAASIGVERIGQVELERRVPAPRAARAAGRCTSHR